MKGWALYHEMRWNVSILCAHNHPSGTAFASEADISITRTLVDAGRLLGIPVVDHVVIGDEEWYSFKQSGLL